MGMAAVEAEDADQEREEAAAKLRELNQELKTTRRQLDEAQKLADRVNKKYYRFQHDVVYTNAGARAIYQQIQQLETQLVDKRKELNKYIVEFPQMRDVMSERRSVFELLTRLKDKEFLIRKQIQAAKWRMAGSPPAEEASGEEPAAGGAEIGKQMQEQETRPATLRRFTPSTAGGSRPGKE